MPDVIANVVVSMPSQLFTLARSFRAASNGRIYIGLIDTDPVDPANQIQVYVENEDGTHVPISQPIIINQAGYPVYNGQISKFVTVQGHSMAVYDMYNAQQFYFPNVLKYDPDQFEKRLSSTANGDGDALIATKQPFTGSRSTTVHNKMYEIVTIADGAEGTGLPDGSSDFSNALANLYAAGARHIRFPYIPGQQNIYFFSYFEPNNIAGVTFHIDDEVKLSLPDDALVGRPSAVNLKFVNSTKVIFRSINTEYVVSPEVNSAYEAKSSFLESESYDYSTTIPVICNQQLKPLISTYGSDTWTAGAFNFSDASNATFNKATGDNTLAIGTYPLKPGDKLSGMILVNSNPYMLAVVRTTGGYYAVKSYSLNDSSLTLVTKLAGSSATESVISIPMQGNHLSYSGVNSEWAIRVNSYTSFDVTFNGYVVASVNTSGYIIDAGFGGYFQNGTSSATVNIFSPVLTRNSRANASRFLAVKVFGDSVSSPRYDCWPVYMKRELELSSGLRAWSIVNAAVAGQTSAQQLAIMQAQGVSDANLVVIAVGTNDAQGLITYDTYKANLNAMLDICQASQKPVVLVKFGLWYTQSQAGQRGQASANYEKGAQYRAIATRVAAERSVKLVDLTEIEGPIVSYYVNQDAAINMVGAGDSVVHDNIHPTSLATKLIGRAIAKAVMGILSPRTSYRLNSALIATAGNGWSINNTDRPIFCDISDSGVLTIGGVIFRGTGVTTDGTVIFTIPGSMAPKGEITVNTSSDQANPVKLVIGINGTAKIYGWTSANYLSLGGISWNVR